MSVLDIQRPGSEMEDETAAYALKVTPKFRKGRGLTGSSGGEIQNIKMFERLENSTGYIETKSSGVQPQGSVEGWVLFITGIHEEATEEDLKEMFSEYGIIKNVVLNLDRRTGFIKGHALVEYDKYQEAVDAKNNLHESQLLGQTIKIEWCFIKKTKLGSLQLPNKA